MITVLTATSSTAQQSKRSFDEYLYWSSRILIVCVAIDCRAVRGDGYDGCNRVLDLRDNASIQLAQCWARARRTLVDLTDNNVAPIAEVGLKQIAAL